MGNKLAKFALEILFLAVFNTLFFVICGTENTTSTWVSYAFIHLAYLFILITPYFNRGTKGLSILGTTLYSISICYFLLELIAGISLIFLQLDSKWTILIQVIMFALFLVVFLSNFMANKATQESIATSQKESNYIKEQSYQLTQVLQLIQDRNAHKKVEKCYELLRCSPTKSTPRAKDIESEIGNQIVELKKVASTNDITQLNLLSDLLKKKIEERNQYLKFIK